MNLPSQSLKTDQGIYLEVEGHACRVINFKEEPPNSAKIVYDAHDTAKEFKKMALPLTRQCIIGRVDR